MRCQSLDKAGIRLKLGTCLFAQTETKWLGFKLSEEGIKLIDVRIKATTDEINPRNLKELRFFMGAITQMNNFIPNLAQLCAPLRPPLSKEKYGMDGGTRSCPPIKEKGNTSNSNNKTIQKETTVEICI